MAGKPSKQTALKPPSRELREHRGNRHGRSEEARQAILEAADNLLVECGFARLTMEGIAAKAGVAKQTIYRWWSSKDDVLMDAFLQDVAEGLVPSDLGSLEADLRSHVHDFAELLGTSDAGAVFRALMAEAQHDQRLAIRLRTEYIGPQRVRDRLPFERAIERGELSRDFEIEPAVEELFSAVYYRVLVSGQSVPREYTDVLVRRLLERTILRHASL